MERGRTLTTLVVVSALGHGVALILVDGPARRAQPLTWIDSAKRFPGELVQNSEVLASHGQVGQDIERQTRRADTEKPKAAAGTVSADARNAEAQNADARNSDARNSDAQNAAAQNAAAQNAAAQNAAAQNAAAQNAAAQNAAAQNADAQNAAAQNAAAQNAAAQNAAAQNAAAQNAAAQNSDAQNSDAQNSDAQNADAQNADAQNADAQNAAAQNAAAQNADAQNAAAQNADAQNAAAQNADAPRLTTLLPRVVASGPEVSDGGASEAALAQDRVDGWLRQTVRQHRVARGLVDPRYVEVRRALADATAQVPDLIGLDDPAAVGRALRDATLPGAERYGRTGAPYATPDGWNAEIEQPDSLKRLAHAGSPEMQRFVQFLSAGARLQEFADGRAGTAIIALVSIKQAADGTLHSVDLTSPSGVRAFDDWVLATARERLAQLHFDAGAAAPLAGLWRFTGRVSFMKQLKQPTARDLLQQIPLMALSGLTGGRVPLALGRFDEVTGAVEVLDLSSPHYQCTVELLEAD